MWVPLALACRLKHDRPFDLAAHSTRATANAPRTAPSMPSDLGVVKRVALRHSLPFFPTRLFYAKPGPARRPLDAADGHDLGLGLRRPAPGHGLDRTTALQRPAFCPGGGDSAAAATATLAPLAQHAHRAAEPPSAAGWRPDGPGTGPG